MWKIDRIFNGLPKMIKAHKIRLNPTAPQENYFYRASGVARFAWNWALEEYKRRKAAGQEIDWNEIKKEFRAKIETEFPVCHAQQWREERNPSSLPSC